MGIFGVDLAKSQAQSLASAIMAVLDGPPKSRPLETTSVLPQPQLG